MITLRHIEIFHAVYQTGSLSGAARLLGVSQPLVSKVLRHAESQLGLTLFGVVKGRLIATEEADRLFEHAVGVQNRLGTLLEAARNLRRADKGVISIAAIHSLGLNILPGAIASFSSKYPEVSLEVRTFHTEELANALHSGDSDFTIGYDFVRHPKITNIPLGTGELVVLFRRDLLTDPPDRVALESLKGHRLIRLINDGTIGSLIARRIESEEPEEAQSIIAVKTYFVAAALVDQGLGIAVMDEFTARACRTDRTDFRPLKEPTDFEVIAAHREDSPLSAVAQQFLQRIKGVLAHS